MPSLSYMSYLGGDKLIIDGIEYRKFNDNYYISQSGDVYSLLSQRRLKHNIDADGYHRVDIYGKHKKVHRLVYETWGGDIPDGMQVNHINDDKNNNSIDNLYLGTQTQNAFDRVRNKHNVGNTVSICVYDKHKHHVCQYNTIRDFLKDTGHSISNGSLAHCLNSKWFKERYDILYLERCRDYRKLYGESQADSPDNKA